MKVDPESGTSQIISQGCWRYTSRHSTESFNDLRMKNLFCDAVLRLEDGGIFPVHRHILSACSSYFVALFTTPLHGIERTDILLPGVTSETMSLILEYAYMKRMDINQENVCELLVYADYFSVLDLSEFCCHFLKRMLTPENCVGTMLFAKVRSPSLEEAARCFVMRNFVQVSQHNDELLELPPEDLKAIIGADELNVTDEEIVLDFVLRWINHDKENRKSNIVELIKEIRLGLLDYSVLENIKDLPYVAGNYECCAIIMRAREYLDNLHKAKMMSREIPERECAHPRIPREILFAIGGCTSGSVDNYMQVYDTRTDRWVMVEKIEPISMRTFYGATVIGFNIYVIVGCSRYDDFNTCHCFNSVAKTWCEVSHMHERRGYLSVAVLDELMYAMGGCCNGRTAERYDHRTNRWSMIAPMNEKRSCSSAAALNGKIYIAGGWCNSAEVYDPDDNKWTLIESMLFSRTFFSCIAYHGYVYAIGGSNSETGSTGEKYNPTTNKWVQIPNMSQPRPHCGIAVIDNKIFTIGEVPLYTKSISVECYDDKSNKWIAARGIEVDRNISCLSACVVKGLPNICDYVKI